MYRDTSRASESRQPSHYFPISADTIRRALPDIETVIEIERQYLDDKMMYESDHYIWLPWKLDQDLKTRVGNYIKFLIDGYAFSFALVHDQAERNGLTMPIITQVDAETHYQQIRQKHTDLTLAEILNIQRTELSDDVHFVQALDTLPFQEEIGDFERSIFLMAAFDGNLLLRQVISI